jgi:hypothetical protein
MIQSTVNVNQAKPLPDGWRWVRLGDVCMINPSRPNGFTRLPDASTTFVPMAAVDRLYIFWRSGCPFRQDYTLYAEWETRYSQKPS